MLRAWNPLSLISAEWAEELYKMPLYGGEAMVKQIQRRLYALIEIRRLLGSMIKKELDELHDEGKLDAAALEAVSIRLAFKLNAWDLHPIPKPRPAPNPNTVKEAIRLRLKDGSDPVTFPDQRLPVPSRLGEALLACLIKRH